MVVVRSPLCCKLAQSRPRPRRSRGWGPEVWTGSEVGSRSKVKVGPPQLAADDLIGDQLLEVGGLGGLEVLWVSGRCSR